MRSHIPEFLVCGLCAATMAWLGPTAAYAGDLTGTWAGTMNASDGASARVEWTFSDADCLILTYSDSHGQTQRVELDQAGLQVQYVPRGGGLRTHVLEAIEVGSGALSFVLSTRFERTNNGYLTQQSFLERYDFTLGADGLNARIAMQSSNYFGDRGAMTGGDNESVSEGVLAKTSD